MSRVYAFNLVQSVSDDAVQRTKNGKGHRNQRRAASEVYVAGEQGERMAVMIRKRREERHC